MEWETFAHLASVRATKARQPAQSEEVLGFDSRAKWSPWKRASRRWACSSARYTSTAMYKFALEFTLTL